MANVLVNENSLMAIADAIREKNGTEDTYTPAQMAPAIEAIEGGGSELPETIALNPVANNLFQGSYLNFLLQPPFIDKLSLPMFTEGDNMFGNHIGKIYLTKPIVFKPTSSIYGPEQLFSGCAEKEFPSVRFYNTLATGFYTQKLCYNCYNVKYLDIDFDSRSTKYNLACSYNNYMFSGCYALRKVPVFLSKVDQISPGNSVFDNLFFGCYALEEATDLPIVFSTAATANVFANAFTRCGRLKNITFQTNEDGSAKVSQMKSQTLNFTSIGVEPSAYLSSFKEYNPDLIDKEVTDEASYELLKDDPDWWTALPAFSRYNHDSAVNTINSLPDTSAYLAANGGTNTIKFNGTYGASTDGGAISTLTDEEIAVATSKGWTVTIT